MVNYLNLILWVNLPKVSIIKSKLKKDLKIRRINFIFGSLGFSFQKGFDIIHLNF